MFSLANCVINAGVLSDIKKKFTGNELDKISDWEMNLVEFLINNDRDFIIAPDYDFSITKILENYNNGLTVEQICKCLISNPKEVYRIQGKVVKKISKIFGNKLKMKEEKVKIVKVIGKVLRDTEKKYKQLNLKCDMDIQTKEQDMKRGQKEFSDEREAVKFLVREQKRLGLGNTVDLNTTSPDSKKNLYAYMNLKRAGEKAGRVSGSTLDLTNLPVLKRGRPRKN